MLFRPGPDVTAALTPGWGPRPPAGLCPPGLAGVLEIGCELLAERGSVLGVQIDLIIGAVEGESHRLLRRAAGQIVFEGYRYFLGHLYLPGFYRCLKRILTTDLRP
jgi:hypothetical protein